MSQNVPEKQPASVRKEYILKNITRQTQEKIADNMGVSRKQIGRDIKKLKETGEWNRFIEETILELSQSGDIDDTTKFREYMKIYSKGFTQKTEVETKGDINITFKAWRPNKDDGDTDKILPT